MMTSSGLKLVRRVITNDVKIVELNSFSEINSRLKIFEEIKSVLEDIQIIMGHNPSQQF